MRPNMELLDAQVHAAQWLDGLPAFVRAVTVSPEDFLEGTGLAFDPTQWHRDQSVGEWKVIEVAPSSIRFRRKNVHLA